MSLEGFDKISTNVDILIGIYKLLEVEDQLRLSCVTHLLRSIYLTYIRKESYRDLQIVQVDTDRSTRHLYVANAKNPKPVLLQKVDLKDFLLAYGDIALELTEKWSLLTVFCSSEVIDICHFRNLTSLTYDCVHLPPNHLSSVAKYCENLQRLQLIYCQILKNIDDKEGDVLVIGDTLSVDTLLTVKKLRHLYIKSSSNRNLEYRHFRQLLGQSSIKSLKVKNMLMPSHELPVVTDVTPLTLRELTITTTFDSDKWSNQFTSFLTCFENLRSLNLTLTDLVTDHTMKVIAEACKSLETFIINDSKFADMQAFQIPLSVMELSLDYCTGLTYNNLKHILTQLQITKFTSNSTRYKGEFEDFKISPHIKCLDVAGIYMEGFKSSYYDNQNLQELVWHGNNRYFYDDLTKIDAPLETCPNLRILTVNSGFIPFTSLVQLANLNVLQLTVSDRMPIFNWSYITAILKHPPLTELSINYSYNAKYDNRVLKATECPVAAFVTNVKLLTISCDTLSAGLQFWLDLYQRNCQMQLVCPYFSDEFYYLEKVIFDEKFPKHSSYIDIWGTTIRCEDLRKNYDVIEKKLNEEKYTFQLFENTHRFVLYRK